jgi:O-antigen/teichoic acid export membrane protein
LAGVAADAADGPHMTGFLSQAGGGIQDHGGNRPRLRRNVTLNLVAEVTAGAVALVSVPLIVQQMGTERFGILSLAWALVGYFSLFDLGLGRAIARSVAASIAVGDAEGAATATHAGTVLLVGLGCLGGGTLAAVTPWLITHALTLSPDLQREARWAFALLAVAVPAVVLSAAFRGALEARQRFDLTSSVRIPLGILVFAAPLGVLPFSHSLIPTIGAIAVVRVGACAAYGALLRYAAPSGRRPPVRGAVAPLLRYGGWTTVSNVVGSLLATMDRFVVGAAISADAVGFYAVPLEVTNRLQVLPNALMGVVFPAFAAQVAAGKTPWPTFRKALLSVAAGVAPAALLLVLFGRQGLGLWLGSTFADRSYPVLFWLALGVTANAVAYVPAGLLQAANRPDIPALLQVAQIAPYLALVWLMARGGGIEAVAQVWALRVLVDAVALFGLAAWAMRGDGEAAARSVIVRLAGDA